MSKTAVAVNSVDLDFLAAMSARCHLTVTDVAGRPATVLISAQETRVMASEGGVIRACMTGVFVAIGNDWRRYLLPDRTLTVGQPWRYSEFGDTVHVKAISLGG